MILANNGLFESPYVLIDKDCNELSWPILWADEEKREICIYEIKNNQILRNDFGYPRTKIIKGINFKIISREDFIEIGMKKKVIEKIKQGV